MTTFVLVLWFLNATGHPEVTAATTAEFGNLQACRYALSRIRDKVDETGGPRANGYCLVKNLKLKKGSHSIDVEVP